jgi:dihydrofolate synthase/folylpolyglutamate synthase
VSFQLPKNPATSLPTSACAKALPASSIKQVMHFSYKGFLGLSIGLLGTHQPYNAAVVIEAVEVLRNKGWAISDEALREGLVQAKLPGRFEICATNPFFIIDGAHNPQSMHVLAQSLKDFFGKAKIIIIMGVLKSKDYGAMLEEILPLASSIILIEVPHAETLNTQVLADSVRKKTDHAARLFEPTIATDIAEALRLAFCEATENDIICACGSLYSVGAIKAALEEYYAKRPKTHASK